MRAGRIVALVIAAMMLVACGSDTPPAANTPDPTGRRDEPVEWYLRSISDDDRTINLVYTISGVASDCQRKGRTLVQESDEKVTVIAHRSVTLDRNRACTEELGYVEEAVTLMQPLGSRALVGCRPGNAEPSEDRVCRDLERSRKAGIFEFPMSSPVP